MPDHFIETVLHTSKIFIHVMAVLLGNACWQALEEQPYANPVGLWTSLIVASFPGVTTLQSEARTHVLDLMC